VGLSPTELAASLQVTPSRVSQMFRALVQRAAQHFGQDAKRATDRLPQAAGPNFAQRMAQRELELAGRASDGPWGRQMEDALTRPLEPLAPQSPDQVDARLRVASDTRWE
jgi:RNA polymerase sigma factor for flagellar operon FliA